MIYSLILSETNFRGTSQTSESYNINNDGWFAYVCCIKTEVSLILLWTRKLTVGYINMFKARYRKITHIKARSLAGANSCKVLKIICLYSTTSNCLRAMCKCEINNQIEHYKDWNATIHGEGIRPKVKIMKVMSAKQASGNLFSYLW